MKDSNSPLNEPEDITRGAICAFLAGFMAMLGGKTASELWERAKVHLGIGDGNELDRRSR